MTAGEAWEKFTAKSERELQKLIASYLMQRGIVFCRPAMHKRSTITTGWPDFTFAVNGQACAIEAKFSGGRLSADQERAIEEMRRNGWKVAVVYSLAGVIDFLAEVSA